MRRVFVLAVLAAAALPAAGIAAPPPVRVHGAIVSVTPKQFVVTTPEGSQTIVFDAKTAVYAEQKGSLADITPGAYIGTTVKPQPDGSLQSSEVHVFPATMRGTGEGYFPMKASPGSMMANATVSSPSSHSMMANATVKNVAGSGAKTVMLVYKGGTKSVTIGPDVPVVKYEPATIAALAAGQHVTVTVLGPPGGYVAARVNFGENGLVPR